MVILYQTMAKLFDYLLAGPFKSTSMRYLVTSDNRLETASDVISSVFDSRVVSQYAVKFRDPGLNRCKEIRLQVAGDCIFHCFSQ